MTTGQSDVQNSWGSIFSDNPNFCHVDKQTNNPRKPNQHTYLRQDTQGLGELREQ